MPPLKNPKHELLAKNVVKHNYNMTKAYLDTYPTASYESANSSVFPLVKSSPAIQGRIQEIANSKGMTVESQIDKLVECQSATKPISFNGKITDTSPDYAVILAATQTGLKIHGVLGQDGAVNIDARSINVNVSDESISRVESIIEKISKLTQLRNTEASA